MINLIKKDQLQARKNKDTTLSKFLGALMSDCISQGKKSHRDPSAEECIAIIKSWLKKAELTQQVNDNQVTRAEIKILSHYLPEQLSIEDIDTILKELGADNMGIIMKHFKSNFHGQYDGKQLSTAVRSFLGT